MTVGSMALGGLKRAMHVPSIPTVPQGRHVELGDRGRTFVLDVPGPTPDAPTVVLLHALATTAALCWYPVLDDLAQHYRVVAFDQRWHGRGIHSERFRLSDCADDTAAVLDAVGVQQATVVGYSMGSAIAQLVWRHHPERVAGLVLGAATRNFRCATRERVFFPLVSAATAPLGPYLQARVNRLAATLPELPSTDATEAAWGKAEFRSTSAWMIPEVLAELGRFNSAGWVHEIDAPTSVIVTNKDHTVPTRRQLRLAAEIRGAEVFGIEAGHGAVVLASDLFRPALLDAVRSAVTRAGLARVPRQRRARSTG